MSGQKLPPKRRLAPERVGLCAGCEHGRAIRGARSGFWFCGLSESDPRFPRYPRLPVLRCSGYRERQAGAG